MKSKIKRHSRSVMSVILAISLLISSMMVGLIATDAARIDDDESVGYGGGSISYTVTKDDNSTATRSASFTLSNNKGTVSMNFSDAKVGSTVTCTLTIDSDVFGGGATLTQGGTGWMTRNSGTFTIAVTAKATVSFNILDMRPSDNPPSMRYSITDNVPDYYLVGNEAIAGTDHAWNINTTETANNLTYTSSTGLYQKRYTLDGGTSTTYTFRIRNKGRNNGDDWSGGANYGFDDLVRPVTDASGLVSSIKSGGGSDDNIQLVLKSAATVTIGINDTTSKIYITVEPTTCTVTTGVTPTGAGNATVAEHEGTAYSEVTVDPGATIDLVATSADASRYVFSKWTASNFLTYDDDTAASTTATVSGSALARAEFTKKKYDVTCSTTGGNGSISVAESSYAWGDTVTVTVTPDDGYTLNTLKVNGNNVTGNSFEMPVGDASVVATFRELQDGTITYGTDGNGYVSVGYQYGNTQDQITQSIATRTEVAEGSKVNFCAIPKPGYKFDGWYDADSGGEQLSTTKDETVTVSGDITRYAHFSALAYKPETGKIKILIAKSAVDDGGDAHGPNPLLNIWGTNFTTQSEYEIPTSTYYTIDSSNYYLATFTTSSTDVHCQVHNSSWTQETKVLPLDDGKMSAGNTYRIEWGGSGKKKGGNLYTQTFTEAYPVSLNVTNPEKASDTHVVAYAKVGDEVTVTATPADDTKKISVLTANDTDIKSTKKFTATNTNPDAVQVTYIDKPYYTVTYTATDGGSVTAKAGSTAIASGDTVMEGTTVTFTATPEKNYIFSAWSGASTATTASVSVTANSDITIQGNFTEVYYQVVDDSGTKLSDMKKLPNGTWISTSTVAVQTDDGATNRFTIKRIAETDSYSHSGAGDGHSYWLTPNSDDTTVSNKVNGRWYDNFPSSDKKQLYCNNLSAAAYVVYDPNATAKNENSYDASCHTGRMWLTNNADGLYPVTVYLKDGTVRADTYKDGSKDTEFFCTALNGNTELVAPGANSETTEGLTASDITDKYKKEVSSDRWEYFVKKVVVPTAKLRDGVKLQIKTTVRDYQFDPSDATKGNAKDYYVKGFDVNGGLTQAVVNQEFNDNDEKTEKASYTDYNKIHGVGNSDLAWNEFTLELSGYDAPSEVEVTPIYFKRAAKSSDNVRFYVEDYVGEVVEKWRGAMAVYPYIEKTYDPFGSYPGQLMVNEGGRYMMDIPASYTNGSGVTTPTQGLTMNNYIWDDVHKDIFFPDISNRSDANYQTYDYNEFEIINKIFQRDGLDEDIIFSFKYKGAHSKENSNLAQAIYYRDYEGYVQDENNANYQKYSDGNFDAYDYRTIQPTLTKAQMADSKYQWEDLTDWYHNKVDIMGNLVENNPEKAAYNPIYIISNGYDYSSVGKYATAWAYYAPVNAAGTEYVWTGDFDHYALFEVMGGQGNQGNVVEGISKFGSESYMIDPTWSDRIIRKYTNQQGTAKILDCENVPCKITYEYEVKQDISNLKDYLVNVKSTTAPFDETDTENMALRSDGRWYYSNSDQLIKAHTIVAIVDASGKVYTRDYYQAGQVDYTKGGYDITDHTTVDHEIKAYFTNNGTETVEGKTFSNVAGNTECNSISDGEHTYDMTTIGDPNGEYEFVGWYYYNGTDYKLASTSMNYSQEAKSNDVFAAVYKKVSAGNFTVSHTLHPDSTGNADCNITVEVKDGATVKYSANAVNDQVKIGPTYIKYNSTYNLVITLNTDPENGTMSLDDFYKRYNNTLDALTTTNISGITSSITIDKASWTATITIPILNLFNNDTEHTQKLKILPFYSKVSKTDYYYYIKYSYLSRYKSYINETRIYGEQYYVAKGMLTDEEIKEYMTFDGGVAAFDNSKKVSFIAAKSPYEDNYKETITWDFSKAPDFTLAENTPEPALTSYTTDGQKTFVTSVAAEQKVDKSLNVIFNFPYAHDLTINESTDDSTFTVTIPEGKQYPVNETCPDDSVTVDYLERFTLNHVTYKDTDKEAAFILTPDFVTFNEEVNGETKAVDKPFNYWSIKTLTDGKEGTEYMRCYSKFFNLALYQDSYIEPVYKSSDEEGFVDPRAVSTAKNASIGYLENSRNQWSEGGGGSIASPRHTFGDRLYSDFVVGYDYNGLELKNLSADKYKVGIIFEKVADIDTTSSLTGARQAALLKGQALGSAKEAIYKDIANGTMSVSFNTEGCVYHKSSITLANLDNKNSIEYYFGFPNKDHGTQEQTDYKYFIYRAVSYLYDVDANTVVLSAPEYFEIYDMASISQGIATPTP